MAANDPSNRAWRRTLDRLLLACRRSDPMPLRGTQLSAMDRRSRRTAPAGPARWRGFSLAAVLILSLLAAIGLSRLRVDDDLRSLLRATDADFQLIDEIASRFGASDRDCIIRASARLGDLFDDQSLQQLKALSESLAGIDGVEQVRSILDIQRRGAAGLLLPVIPRTHEPLSADALQAARQRAVRHPLIAGHLLSADATSSLLLARLAQGADAPPQLGETIKRIEKVLADQGGKGAHLDLELTGLPALRDQAARALRRDMLLFNSLGLIFAVVLSATVAGSLRSIVVACVPPFVGAVWAVGALGLVGAPVNILSSVVPSLALVVGTCDSIHFIEDMRRGIRRGIDPLTASCEALYRVGTACGLTSLVTAIGFASLALARIDAVRAFGIAAAAGAVASFLAVTLLTPLLASTRLCRGMHLGNSSRLAGRVANLLTAFSIRYARPIVLIGCLATLLLGVICLRLDADTRVIDALPQGAAAAQALGRVDREFGGTMSVDVLVQWPLANDWRDPVLLETLDDVHNVLDTAGGITRVISLATIANTLPERARQRLKDEDFREVIDSSSRSTIVRARVSDLGSRALEAIYGRIDDGLEHLEAKRPGWQFDLAGISVVSARNIRQLVHDLGSSLLLEVIVIGAILTLAFRSLWLGIVSLVPNIFPLAIIGAMLVGTGRALDPATVIVFNVCLGLAVDDTVHVLSALSRHRRKGISTATAVRRAVAETGNPIVLGGVVLSVGFAAVTVSSVPTLAGFGRLACVAVAAATVAELILLPALLVVTDRFSTSAKPRNHETARNLKPLYAPSLSTAG